MKKTYKITTLHTLFIIAIILLAAISLQSSFAATTTIDNSTSGGGISGALNSSANGDTIILEEGIYTGNNNTNMTINKNITIQGETKDKVILDAQGLSRIFTIASNLNVTFINITFINGYNGTANGGAILSSSQSTILNVMNCTFINNTAPNNQGGAINNNGNYSVIDGCTFINNTADNRGAALHLTSSSFVTVNNCNFINNAATTGFGGAVHISNGPTNITFSGCNFTNNTSGGSGNGGGGLCIVARNVTLIGCNFVNNTSGGVGGGISTSIGPGNLKLINCNFTNNIAHRGGAIYIFRNNTLVSGCTFVNNSAATLGGAILSDISSYNTLISGCTFVNNSANTTSGGAISLQASGVNATVTNCTFVNNSAATAGGAIINFANSTSINNCTFVNNSANTTSGGAISLQASGVNATVTNCTFVNNSAATAGGAIINFANSTSINNCTFVNNSASTFGGAIANVFSTNNNGSGNITIVDSNFTNNSAGTSGGAIFNGVNGNVNMLVSNNKMSGNSANVLGQMIYNNGTMGVLNLTFIGNSTWVVRNGSNFTIFATLTDDMGNTVTGQNISFYLNDVLYEDLESIEGQANFTYAVNGLPGDLIPVNGTYAGIGTFDIIIKQGLLNIKIATKTTINGENTTVGKPTNITGVVTDEDGNPLANTVLNVTVDGKTYTVTTDSNGQWSLPYIPTHTGNIEASVSWAGNDTHNGFTNNTNFNVAKRNIIVTINVTENPDGSMTIIANATYEDGSPASDYPVDFILDGKIIGSKVTDSNGIATLTIPANKISDGPHIFSVVVIGGDNANDATASTEFTKTSKDNPTSKTSNKPAATAAAMKNTGIPIIAIILLLLTSIGLIVVKKRKLNTF